MAEATPQPARKGLVKAAVLLAFIAGAVYLVRYSPLKGYFTPEALTGFVEGTGFWAPPVFVVLYAAGVCLFLPGTLLTALGNATTMSDRSVAHLDANPGGSTMYTKWFGTYPARASTASPATTTPSPAPSTPSRSASTVAATSATATART